MRRGRKISAEELRKMPEGTWVILHGRDRRGYSTELRCRTVKTKDRRAMRLMVLDFYTVGYRPINKLDGAVHWYELMEDGDGHV